MFVIISPSTLRQLVDMANIASMHAASSNDCERQGYREYSVGKAFLSDDSEHEAFTQGILSYKLVHCHGHC